MSLVQRLINVTFTLAQGSFGGSGQNTVKLSGLRTTAKIVKGGGPSMSMLNLRVYGLPLSMMNQLSTLGMRIMLIPRNVVTVEAGDAEGGMSIVFIGTITEAYADFQAAPDVPFVVTAQTGLLEAAAPTEPTSYKGRIPADAIMSSLATRMGIAFEDALTNPPVLSDPYFSGSLRDQALKCAEAGGFEWIIDNGVLAIWPRGGARQGAIPLIQAPEMVSYPAYTAQGILVRSLYNRAVGFGGKVQIVSELTPANGIWSVYRLDYDLESLMPNGQWFMSIGCYNPNFPPPVLQ